MFLTAIKQEANNLESIAVVQELELAIGFFLLSLANQYNIGTLSWFSLALAQNCRTV